MPQNNHPERNPTAQLTHVRKATVYRENPFLNGQIAAVKPGPMRRKSFAIAGASAGETIVAPTPDGMPNGITHTAFTFVEDTHFAKVYMGAIAHLYDLTHAEFKLMIACFEHLGAIGQFQGIALLNEENTKLPTTTFNRAIRGLIERKILARCSLSPNAYFVHPQFVFKGDRARFVMEFRKKKNEDTKTMPLGLPGFDNQEA